MRILFVRHGEPDYEKDCLTPRGRQQAREAAKRLEREGINEIYASPCGRAYETAQATAELLGLPVTVLDYMHEISWGGPGIPEGGHLWTLSDRMLEEGFDFHTKDWREHPYFKENSALGCYDLISEKIDAFLLPYGYRHQGMRYFCEAAEPAGASRTIAVFSHGGSGACAMAHLLGIPFPYYLCVYPYDYTSVISLDFPYREGCFVHPRVELFGDAEHIKGISDGLAFQQTPDQEAL